MPRWVHLGPRSFDQRHLKALFGLVGWGPVEQRVENHPQAVDIRLVCHGLAKKWRKRAYQTDGFDDGSGVKGAAGRTFYR